MVLPLKLPLFFTLTITLTITITITIALLSAETMAAITTPRRPRGFVVPLGKHGATSYYIAKLDLGLDATFSTNVVVHLGGDATWYSCLTHYNSSSYRRVTSSSPKCKLFKPSDSFFCTVPGLDPTCSSLSCWIDTYNPVGDISFHAALGQDTFAFRPNPYEGRSFHSPRMVFACVQIDMTDGLIAGTFGMLSLSKHAASLPMQLSSAVKIPPKFALCMPSKTDKYGFGGIFLGDGPYPAQVSKLLSTTTKMITNPISAAKFHANGEPSHDYYMGVRSVSIDGKVLPLDASLFSIDKKGNGGTKFSTVDTLTVLHSSIYTPFVEAFKAKAKAKNMVLVQPWSDTMTTCFSARSVPDDVPVIELALQDGGTWKIYGSNSMVRMFKDVTCLAVVDGGTKPVLKLKY